jgi:beta-N-acetylhexosaminidase
VVAAGCDAALHCSGEMAEMIAVAKAVPVMSLEADARLARAMAATLVDGDGQSLEEAIANRDSLLALA